MKKIFFITLALLLTSLVTFLAPTKVQAFRAETFVTFSNPVRGPEFWQDKTITPLDLPKFQYQEATHSSIPITWLLRYDAVTDATISAYFDSLIETDSSQSLGAFLEITPSLTGIAGVEYPSGFLPVNANRIFLSGYTQKDRRALIDTYMEAFFNRFGFYPKSVSAWDLDSYSLLYLQEKYSVLSAMNCDEQYNTDHYRLWGGYLGSPYYPHKNNSLIPAKSSEEKINLVMVRWAQRDLYNFYGKQGASSFSVQVNDYTSYGLKTDYFDKLMAMYSQKDLNEFTHINIGLENDYSLNVYKDAVRSQYKSIEKNKGKYSIHYISLSDFGDWFKARYPESSPTYFYKANDSRQLEDGEVYWYQSPFYRVGIKSKDGISKIIDLRVYNPEIYEDNYATPNQSPDLFFEIPASVDSVKNPGTEINLDINLQKAKSTNVKRLDYWQITFEEGEKRIVFNTDNIIFEGFTPSASEVKDIDITTSGINTTWKVNPKTPFKENIYEKAVYIAIILGAIFYIFRPKKNKKKQTLVLALAFVFGLLSLQTLAGNGLLYSFGMGYWGPNGHDAIFHISLIEKFRGNFLNFSHPQIQGEILTNYHFVFDYLLGLISKFTNLSSFSLYFKIIPTLLCLGIIFLLNNLLAKWKYTSMEKIVAFFMIFLGGSFGFIPRLISGQNIFAGESAFWANQSSSMFLNPPFVLSILILLIFLNKLKNNKKIDIKTLLILSLLGGVLSQTKIYAFILLVIGLLVNRQFKLTLLVGIFGLGISAPLSSLSSSPFQFAPLWFTRSLFASGDRVFWQKLSEAWQVYEITGNIPKLFVVNIFATSIFIIGNLGIRVLGIIKFKPVHTSQKISFAIVVAGIIIPLLFIQKINPWNTIQFMYYSIFFLGIFSAKTIVSIISKIKQTYLKLATLVLILILGSFTSIGTLQDYFSSFSASRISYTELQALETLAGQEDGVVLSPPFNISRAHQVSTPKPLFAYVSNAYISAMTGKREYLSDTINLDITGFDYTTMQKNAQRLYDTKDIEWGTSFLKDNGIAYVYETPLKKIALNPVDLCLTSIFDSGEINIYKFNCHE